MSFLDGQKVILAYQRGIAVDPELLTKACATTGTTVAEMNGFLLVARKQEKVDRWLILTPAGGDTRYRRHGHRH